LNWDFWSGIKRWDSNRSSISAFSCLLSSTITDAGFENGFSSGCRFEQL
jgi:hypothetical protein